MDAHDAGKLYVVATPIGNLLDMSSRAVDVLSSVDVIAAEDTRHSKKLLAHFGVGTRMIALHEHNEKSVAGALINRLMQGDDIAIISDAGTPLISDPGYTLVRTARQAGIDVRPVPGPSALTAALSVAGLPTDRFHFEGFLPARQSARRQRLSELRDVTVTMVFYESSHRICASLKDMVDCFGAGREAVVTRELTKVYETTRAGSLEDLSHQVESDAQQQKGEFVVLVHGAAPVTGQLDAHAQYALEVLLEELPLKQAVAVTARITGVSRNSLYDLALELKNNP